MCNLTCSWFVFVLHYFLLCQKQAFSCSFAFSSSPWINSTSSSNGVWRRRCVIIATQSWEHPFWNPHNPVITSNSRHCLNVNGARGLNLSSLVFYCLILSRSMFFVLEYYNNIFVKVLIFLLGTKIRKIQKVFFSPIPQVRHSKLW